MLSLILLEVSGYTTDEHGSHLICSLLNMDISKTVFESEFLELCLCILVKVHYRLDVSGSFHLVVLVKHMLSLLPVYAGVRCQKDGSNTCIGSLSYWQLYDLELSVIGIKSWY